MSQFVLHDELWWVSEFSCESCGTRLCEHAGPGAAPDDVRQALLAAHGSVTLRPTGPAPGLVPVLRALREASGVSLPQARELAAELVRDGLAGTPAEMGLLRDALHRRGVPADVQS
ncbi:hypothetical protein [Streptomyces sp. NPDC014894]|uniref:hypothetical protein n=1 Tax=Streptomyces sp. NPDC014894 TaxID=3364931 RepID=UPI0036FDC0D9